MATNKTEASELRRMGAKVHKNSGRGQTKGDGSLDEFVVDVKEYNKSFTISVDNWAKICTDTFKVNRNMHPALKVIIGEDSKVRLGIVEWAMLEELITFWEENHVKR